MYVDNMVVLPDTYDQIQYTHSLKTYRAKRDFTQTPEPKSTKRNSSSKKMKFVIHQHHARAMHYDLRLQVGRVMPSWAVPKGPSLNPKDKRLAVKTEDHPLDYATFEGIIPPGQYGAGSVIIWDNGYYHNIKRKNGRLVPMKECIEHGSCEFFLMGKKLQGAFALVRMQNSDNWLLIKMDDEFAKRRGSITKQRPESVVSGKTVTQLARESS